jgi:hypothetical protein
MRYHCIGILNHVCFVRVYSLCCHSGPFNIWTIFTAVIIVKNMCHAKKLFLFLWVGYTICHIFWTVGCTKILEGKFKEKLLITRSKLIFSNNAIKWRCSTNFVLVVESSKISHIVPLIVHIIMICFNNIALDTLLLFRCWVVFWLKLYCSVSSSTYSLTVKITSLVLIRYIWRHFSC